MRRRHRAAEADLVGHFRTLELPGIAEGQPVLRLLDLPAIVERLTEQAMIVADTIAEAGDANRPHALQEAGREPPEAAIAERGVGLELLQLSSDWPRSPSACSQTSQKPEIGEAVDQQAADQELHREVIDPLFLPAVDLARAVHPAHDKLVAHRERGRDQPVTEARMLRILADRKDQLAQDLILEALRGHRGRLRLHQFIVVLHEGAARRVRRWLISAVCRGVVACDSRVSAPSSGRMTFASCLPSSTPH